MEFDLEDLNVFSLDLDKKELVTESTGFIVSIELKQDTFDEDLFNDLVEKLLSQEPTEVSFYNKYGQKLLMTGNVLDAESRQYDRTIKAKLRLQQVPLPDSQGSQQVT